MIRVENVSKHFGGLKAVDCATIEIAEGSITGLIGPNGAGKTTLFNTIAGLYTPTSGGIFLDDEEITGLKPHQLFGKGLLRTFQIAHEFSRLSVIENLMMVPARQSGENLVNAWFRRTQVQQEEDSIRERALDVIDFLNLRHIANEIAGNLSGGQKKLLELGRTMMVDAKIVFLDEVGAATGRLRIAVQTAAFNGVDVHPDCVAAVEHAAELCRGLGHEVVPAAIDLDWEPLGDAARVVIAAHLRATLDARAADSRFGA